MKLTNTGKIVLGVFVFLLTTSIWLSIQVQKSMTDTYESMLADRKADAPHGRVLREWQRKNQRKRSDQAYADYVADLKRAADSLSNHKGTQGIQPLTREAWDLINK